MIRKSSYILIFLFPVLFFGWCLAPAQEKGNVPAHVQAKLEALRKEAQDKNWTFQVGNSAVSDRPLDMLAGTVVPANINVAQAAAKVNTYGLKMLAIDVKARNNFAKDHPNVLPGQKIEARTQPQSHAVKSKFDWKSLGKVTPVRDQGSCGSCWDFTAVGAFECNYLIRNNIEIDASEQQILDCSGAGTCGGGWWMGAFDYMLKHGIGNEKAYPYTGKQGNCNDKVPSPYKAVSWAFVAQNGEIPSVELMKTKLCEHGPLAVAVNATPAFQHYSGGVFNENATGPINHGILLVGWDDNKGKNGAWLIRNSWTTSWGEQGYMWIEYGCNRIGDHAAWVETESVHYHTMTLLANDYRVKEGQTVSVPIHLLWPTKVKNMNWTLKYGTNTVTLVEPQVLKGNLPLTLFEANPREPGLVRMGFAQSDPITEGGTTAILRFKATGPPGSKTPLTLAVSKINGPTGEELPIKLIDGSIEIVQDSRHLPKGSCYGGTTLTIADARCALQMSVGNRPVELNMDMDNDGQVTSRDAAIILQQVLDQTRRGQ